MKKKKVHIISHSHWDREWYMPFEYHRYLLVELIDDIISLCENDPNFKYFHLDGQIIPIYDYLEIKPENKEKLLKYIKNGQIQIGPWYILQDAFLSGAEANIRNLLYGLKHSKKLGANPPMVGYFPDTFGNISQAPQILNKFGIDFACFGRGLNEVGFDNQIVKQDGINKSELIWKSEDGSEVISILFANWYCNANDIPLDDDMLEKTFSNIITNCEKFALTPNLLAMNGCDHTPVQKNISKVINKLQTMFPDYEIVHSNFIDYINEIRKYKDNFRTYEGEIIGQLTTGYNLLNNTASTRVDIKKINYLAQNTLETETEPIQTINNLYGFRYDSEYIEKTWLNILENHTHDSICSCSVDPVNSRVKQSLTESLYKAEIARNEAIDRIIKTNINKTTDKFKSVIVFNKDIRKTNKYVKTKVSFPKDMKVRNIIVKDNQGNIIPSLFNLTKDKFTYTLPKQGFRRVEYVDQFEVEFLAKDIGGLGYSEYFIYPTDNNQNESKYMTILGNEFYTINLNSDGSLNIISKELYKDFKYLTYFEYQANIGNEYNFEQSLDKLILTTKDSKAEIGNIKSTKLYDEVEVINYLKVPLDIKKDKTCSKLLTTTKFRTKIRLYKNSGLINFNVTIDNKAKNSRYRIVFDPKIETDYVLSEGQFDLVKRSLIKPETWKNPVKTDRFTKFFCLENDKEGAIISSLGLHEYEILKDNKMALTLLSSIDQMGDWGIFPTPDSQMIGRYNVSFSFGIYDVDKKDDYYNYAYNYYKGNLCAKELPNLGDRLIESNLKLIETNNKKIVFSSLKKSETTNDTILRVYSNSSNIETAIFNLNNCFETAYLVNLNEDEIKELEIIDNKLELRFKPKEIITIKLRGKLR